MSKHSMKILFYMTQVQNVSRCKKNLLTEFKKIKLFRAITLPYPSPKHSIINMYFKFYV